MNKNDFDSLNQIEEQRKRELEKIEKEKELQRLKTGIQTVVIDAVIEYYGIDNILDQIGFEKCKEYFKIELGND